MNGYMPAGSAAIPAKGLQRHAMPARERALQRVDRAEPAAAGDAILCPACRAQQPGGGSHACLLDITRRRAAGLGGKGAREMARAQLRALGQCVDRQIVLQVRVDVRQQRADAWSRTGRVEVEATSATGSVRLRSGITLAASPATPNAPRLPLQPALKPLQQLDRTLCEIGERFGAARREWVMLEMEYPGQLACAI